MKFRNVAMFIMGVLAGGAPAAIPEGKPVSDYFYLEDANVPLKLGVTPKPIQDKPRKDEPKPAAARGDDASLVIGQGSNGRTQGRLSAETYVIKARAERGQQVPVYDIRAVGNRIVLQGEGAMEIYDRDLRRTVSVPVQSGTFRNLLMNPGMAAIDAPRDLAYACDTYGMLSAWNMGTGKRAFTLASDAGGDFGMPLVLRQGNKIVTVSVELQRDPHGGHLSSQSVVTAKKIQDPPQIDQAGEAKSEKILQLRYASALLIPAQYKTDLILVCGNAYYLADLDLKIKAAYEGSFQPVALSLDEAGLLHLIVQEKDAQALWVLDLGGRRLVSFPLAPEWGPVAAAPVIGYDHRIFLVFQKRIVVVSALGKKIGEETFGDWIRGVSITADNKLLVSSGSEIASLAADGKRGVLARIEGDNLASPAAVTPDGDMLVAGSKNLYRLSPKK